MFATRHGPRSLLHSTGISSDHQRLRAGSWRRCIAAIRHIEEAPERQPIIRGRLRRVLLRRFPYGVYYKLYPSTISVVGVIHGHRHPDTWLGRAAP